ncbi:MAG: phosphate signaling complex protein PhoU [Candidatus Ventricola sp.]
MRKRYDEQLDMLHGEIIRMGEMIERAILGAVSALETHDVDRAKAIIAADEEIDHQEKLVEGLCMKLLLSQQPVAGDLRRVSSALKVITDMERIGDHATDISELTLMLGGVPGMGALDLREMAAKTCEMLLGSLEAFVNQDTEQARAVIAKDDEVDELFLRVKDDIIDALRGEPGGGEEAIDLLMAAKYFERIGDHATNIAEWAIYAVSGEHEA